MYTSYSYRRGDIVIMPFPFVTSSGTQQKARRALVISDHSLQRRFDDVILVGITSPRIGDIMKTEYLIEEGTKAFKQSGLATTSVVRCDYLMTVPQEIIARKPGNLPKKTMNAIVKVLI